MSVKRLNGSYDDRDLARIRKVFNGNKAMFVHELIDALEAIQREHGPEILVMSQSWPVSGVKMLGKVEETDVDIVEVELDMGVPQRAGYDPVTNSAVR